MKNPYICMNVYNTYDLQEWLKYTDSDIIQVIESTDGYRTIVVGNGLAYIVGEMEQNTAGVYCLEFVEGMDDLSEALATAWEWTEAHDKYLKEMAQRQREKSGERATAPMVKPKRGEQKNDNAESLLV